MGQSLASEVHMWHPQTALGGNLAELVSRLDNSSFRIRRGLWGLHTSLLTSFLANDRFWGYLDYR